MKMCNTRELVANKVLDKMFAVLTPRERTFLNYQEHFMTAVNTLCGVAPEGNYRDMTSDEILQDMEQHGLTPIECAYRE